PPPTSTLFPYTTLFRSQPRRLVERDRPRDRHARRHRRPDLFQRQRPAARWARVGAALRSHGGAQAADLAPPGAAGGVRRLPRREAVTLRHLVGVRLAL